jgi:DNA-binding MarR family transcriptional regulator/N-acetylglutamate synthase-like GNAT family acetyltransferase
MSLPTLSSDAAQDQRIAAIRRFNRFYTKRIGVLEDGLLKSAFSLAEARLLYELAQREETTAALLGKELGLDPGYLSRMLAGFEKRGLLRKAPSPEDGRQTLLSLTAAGRTAFARLDAGARDEIAAMLQSLQEAEQQHLLASMAAIEALLRQEKQREPPFLLRPHRPGDMGWVIGRHGALYAAEYGWSEEFEAFVAVLAAKFIREFDAKRERCWMAEINGETVGSVFLVKKSRTTAQLRMLLVEPHARGLGIGKRLVEECIRFARHAGYRKVTLWTNSVLHAARRIYEAAGFSLVSEEPHQSFGQELVGQTWSLDLQVPASRHASKQRRRAEP